MISQRDAHIIFYHVCYHTRVIGFTSIYLITLVNESFVDVNKTKSPYVNRFFIFGFYGRRMLLLCGKETIYCPRNVAVRTCANVWVPPLLLTLLLLLLKAAVIELVVYFEVEALVDDFVVAVSKPDSLSAVDFGLLFLLLFPFAFV